MWGQQKSSTKRSEPEAAKQEDKSRSMGEPSLGKSSLYDSGRTDSGFLSGGNLLSDTSLVSEEIPTPSPTTSKQDLDKVLSKSYSRLDSGVDVGLSDQLSDLCIDELGSEVDDKTNVMISRLDVQPDPVTTHKPSQKLLTPDPVSRIPWENYFKQDEDGDTQLHIAIIQGFVDVVFHLIRLVPKSSYLDIKNDEGQTPLHLAALTGQWKVARRLVCGGADARLGDHSGNTPLHLATASGDFPTVKALTEPVIPTEVLSAQLRYSAPVIRLASSDIYNYEGLTSVHLAILGGHIGILMYLVKDVQANINARELKGGMSCLHMACEAGNESLALILLELGADCNTQNYAGETPYGVSRYHQGVLRLLLAKGASYEVFTDDEEDDEDDFQMYAFRDLHINGIVNVTAA